MIKSIVNPTYFVDSENDGRMMRERVSLCRNFGRRDGAASISANPLDNLAGLYVGQHSTSITGATNPVEVAKIRFECASIQVPCEKQNVRRKKSQSNDKRVLKIVSHLPFDRNASPKRVRYECKSYCLAIKNDNNDNKNHCSTYSNRMRMTSSVMAGCKS